MPEKPECNFPGIEQDPIKIRSELSKIVFELSELICFIDNNGNFRTILDKTSIWTTDFELRNLQKID
jgi:hypothetical protein